MIGPARGGGSPRVHERRRAPDTESVLARRGSSNAQVREPRLELARLNRSRRTRGLAGEVRRWPSSAAGCVGSRSRAASATPRLQARLRIGTSAHAWPGDDTGSARRSRQGRAGDGAWALGVPPIAETIALARSSSSSRHRRERAPLPPSAAPGVAMVRRAKGRGPARHPDASITSCPIASTAAGSISAAARAAASPVARRDPSARPRRPGRFDAGGDHRRSTRTSARALSRGEPVRAASSACRDGAQVGEQAGQPRRRRGRSDARTAAGSALAPRVGRRHGRSRWAPADWSSSTGSACARRRQTFRSEAATPSPETSDGRVVATIAPANRPRGTSPRTENVRDAGPGESPVRRARPERVAIVLVRFPRSKCGAELRGGRWSATMLASRHARSRREPRRAGDAAAINHVVVDIMPACVLTSALAPRTTCAAAGSSAGSSMRLDALPRREKSARAARVPT